MKTFSKIAFIVCFSFAFNYSSIYAQNGTTQFSAKINGSDFVPTPEDGFSQIFAVLVKTPMFFQLSINGSTVIDNVAKSILVSIMDEKSFNTVGPNTVWDSKNDGGKGVPVGHYFEVENDNEKEATTESTEDSYLKITFIDKTKRIVSGEFRFTASDGVNTYSITDGVFTNVSYKNKI
ncbi:hypothetical protein BWZ22_05845 [Seonamhaeicola sp. S2-3]|uniref:hypothetical protein n=1 Tax=Seonamhaeicola sp. S2-3 TaxID=1936081 RepID=UPI0009728371|nr:hypothetical protein [Seonamhaeicola sp. S2-3]APY10790.1 hypothetical protein BWZ22_05845 [Seonamhaeicola sp. S2-3]